MDPNPTSSFLLNTTEVRDTQSACAKQGEEGSWKPQVKCFTCCQATEVTISRGGHAGEVRLGCVNWLLSCAGEAPDAGLISPESVRPPPLLPSLAKKRPHGFSVDLPTEWWHGSPHQTAEWWRGLEGPNRASSGTASPRQALLWDGLVPNVSFSPHYEVRFLFDRSTAVSQEWDFLEMLNSLTIFNTQLSSLSDSVLSCDVLLTLIF